MKLNPTRIKAGIASFLRITAAVVISAEAITKAIEDNPNIDWTDYKTVGLVVVGPAIITGINAFRKGEKRFGRTDEIEQPIDQPQDEEDAA